MGKVNVYLPDDLEREVRELGIPMSSVCQQALRAAAQDLTLLRTATDVAASARLTPRLAEILGTLQGRTPPAGALELLGAILLHGENLGARVLVDLGVELPPPAGRGRRRRDLSSAGLSAEVRDVLVDAARIALDLRHDHLGTEHVVLALSADGAPTAGLFAALGIDDRAIRARVERLVANPWRTDAAPDAARAEMDPARLDRMEAELRRLGEELHRMRLAAGG